MFYNDSNLFNDPNLIISSIIIPLKDFSFILAFVFSNVHSFPTEWFEIKSVGLIVKIGRDKLPKLVNLFVWLAANNFGSIVLISLMNLNGLIGFDTEDTVLVSPTTLEIKLLIVTIVPVVKNQLIVMVMVLRNIQNHVTWESTHDPVMASLIRSPS